MMVTITNLQRALRINVSAWEELAAWFMERAKAMNPRNNWLECSVVLVGHRKITEVNEQVLRHEGTTDVITFHYRSEPGEPKGWRGEILINVEEAVAAGTARPGGVPRELALYLAHGCQHLGGANDRTPAERSAMSQRQNRWLRHPDVLRIIRRLLA